MTDQVIQAGDTGTIIELMIQEDGVAKNISAATALSFVFLAPDRTIFERTAQISTNGLDGKMRYVSTAQDFTQAGIYTVQAQLTLPGWSGRSSLSQLRVRENLN